MKSTEQDFPVVLFIKLYKVVLTFESVDEIRETIQMKATEQYFHALLFSMRYKDVITYSVSLGSCWTSLARSSRRALQK